jgi:hypothetical protein
MWWLAGYGGSDVACLECFANRLRKKFNLRTQDIIQLPDEAALANAKMHHSRVKKAQNARRELMVL